MSTSSHRELPDGLLWDYPVSLVTPDGIVHTAHSQCGRQGPKPTHLLSSSTYYSVSVRCPSVLGSYPKGTIEGVDESPWHALLGVRIVLESVGLRLAIAASQPGLYPLALRRHREATVLTDLVNDQVVPGVSFVTAVNPDSVGTVAQQQLAYWEWYQRSAPVWRRAERERAERRAAHSDTSPPDARSAQWG
jgi:hypothetical protein